MNTDELHAAMATYTGHLRTVCGAFNAQAELKGVPVRMDAAREIASVEAGHGLARVSQFASRVDDDGVIHPEQLKTFVDCMERMLATPYACGHVLGAMQSGKTTTSLALQWAGPIYYLLKGERPYPFYIISNQTNHEDQTNRELQRFVTYYGGLGLRVEGVEGAPDIDAMFALGPSLETYRQHVLRSAMQDIYSVDPLDDLVYCRVGGDKAVADIADLCRRTTEQGYRPLMIIDEPQFGAGDRIVNGKDGPERRACVLQQIFERIELEVGSERGDHWFIGLSATPFELNDLSRIWEVRQYLSNRYTGFNCFNRAPIDGDADVHPPRTLGLADLAHELDDPDVAKISMTAYAAPLTRFAGLARKIDYEGSQDDYRDQVVGAMRRVIDTVLAQYTDDAADPVGLCIRAFNNNEGTEALIDRLALDPQRVEVIKYYGQTSTGQSIKRVIAARKTRLPYVIFVTNRARMADAFPPAVRFFWDMAQKASDLNALLQGLLGRACGYDKASTVVLSDVNAAIVQAYRATNGGYVFKTSRNSVTVGGYRRGAPSGMIKLMDDMNDPVVRDYFARINREVVAPHFPSGAAQIRYSRSSPGKPFRTGPILTIADDLDLFDHIEAPATRSALFPQIPGGFQVVRAGDQIRHSRQPGVLLGYELDDEGGCRYTFRRTSRGASAQGGAAGRARGARDTGQHLEPTLYIEKFDPATGAPIDRDDDRPGDYRAFMITFPLREPVRELETAIVAYPSDLSPYDDWMEAEERQFRDA